MVTAREFLSALNNLHNTQATCVLYGITNSNKAVAISFQDGVIVGFRWGLKRGKVGIESIQASEVSSLSIINKPPHASFIQSNLPKTSEILALVSSQVSKPSLDASRGSTTTEREESKWIIHTPSAEDRETSPQIDRDREVLPPRLIAAILTVFQDVVRSVSSSPTSDRFESVVKRSEPLKTVSDLDKLQATLVSEVIPPQGLEEFNALVSERLFATEDSLQAAIKEQFRTYLGPLANDIYELDADEVGEIEAITDIVRLIDLLATEIDVEEDKESFLAMEFLS